MCQKHPLFELKKLTLPIFESATVSVIEHAYADVSGYLVDRQELDAYQCATGDTTYGELTNEGASSLLSFLRLKHDDLFVDVGCGVGKLLLMAALSTPAAVFGVEIVPTRHRIALECITGTCALLGLDDWIGSKVWAINDDATQVDMSPATVVYMCSTCFPDAAVHAIIQSMSPKARLISARPISHARLKRFASLCVPTTWSPSVELTCYEIVE